jgi:N-acetyl sugar amidotransferase
MAYKVCSRCIMDTTDPEIEFDENGYCNHCRHLLYQRSIMGDPEFKKNKLAATVQEIKENGKDKQYDCIVGVSGGTDSTYVAYLAKDLGLRPLAVHLDNGWDAELAVSNIEKTLKTLGIDLFTYVLDWEEFKDLQISFLKASVSDAELPSDHAIRAVQYQAAAQHGVKYIINGRNLNTEGILPWSWTYSVMDWKYIKAVHKKYGNVKLKTFPHYNLVQLANYVMHKRIKLVNILNYFDYSKKEAIDILQTKLDWRDYGGKHYESIYTRFFQAYILPKKFNIDKRMAHLSVLVCTGEISREEAFAEMKKPTCEEDMMESDREYVIKKFNMTDKDFEEIMQAPTTNYTSFDNNSGVFLLHKNTKMRHFARGLKKMRLLPSGFADYALKKKETEENATP